MKFAGEKEIDVYAVGWLALLLGLGRSIRARHLGAIRLSLTKIRHQWGVEKIFIRDRNWRAIRNGFNGYVAEHGDGESDAGHGWTKRAALRRLARIRRGM
jgi:hypothetical protein